jgi:hypothetical protein
MDLYSLDVEVDDISASIEEDLTLNDPLTTLRIIRQSPNDFTKFPDLPMELRLKIWDEVAMHPRLVELRMIFSYSIGEEPGVETEGSDAHKQHGPTTVTDRTRRPPSVIQANKEARNRTLPFYVNFLEMYDIPKPLNGYVFFNPKVDYIFFGEQAKSRR